MKSQKHGQPVPQGEHWRQVLADPSMPQGPREEYLQVERGLMRYTCPWGVLLAVPGIPVAAAHGVPTALAIIAGLVLAAAFVITAVTWRQRWSWPVCTVLAVLPVWPAIVWVPWLFFWGLGMLFLALVAAVLWAHRRNARESIAKFGPRYADWGSSA